MKLPEEKKKRGGAVLVPGGEKRGSFAESKEQSSAESTDPGGDV